MKTNRYISFTYFVPAADFLSKITLVQTANNHKVNAAIDTNIPHKTFCRDCTDIDSLKEFDTATIAYYMMGFGNF